MVSTDPMRNCCWYVEWIPVDAVAVVTSDEVVSSRTTFRHTAERLQSALMEDFTVLSGAMWTQSSPLAPFSEAALQVLQNHFLLMATSHSLLLLRLTPCGMQTVAVVDVRADLCVEDVYGLPSRLALVKVMPELSAVVAWTQGNGIISIYQICQHSRSGQFQFIFQGSVRLQTEEEFSDDPKSVIGMTVVRDSIPIPASWAFDPVPSYTLYAANYGMKVKTFRMTSQRTEVSVTGGPRPAPRPAPAVPKSRHAPIINLLPFFVDTLRSASSDSGDDVPIHGAYSHDADMESLHSEEQLDTSWFFNEEELE